MNLLIAGAKKIAEGGAPDDPTTYEAMRQFMMQPHSSLDSTTGQIVTTTPQYSFPAYAPSHAGGMAQPPDAGAPPAAPSDGQPNLYDPAAAAVGTPMQPAPPQVAPPEVSQPVQVPGTNATVTQLPGRAPGTPDQLKVAGYRDRLQEADKILSQLNDAGTSYVQQGLGHVPVVGNALKSEDRQRLEQAQRDFTNANLRRESGAVIGEPEFANAAQQYFPQPGDTRAVLEQKARNRETVVNNFKREAGRVPELPSASGAGHPELPPGFQVLP